MTKTIGIYSVQVVLGAIAIAAGYAKLSGAGLMVQQFQVLGLGHGFLFAAGTAEIVAGLCLLLPRGGVLGAVLLSCVMVGALGVTIGHLASAVAAPANAAHVAIGSHRAIANAWTGGADRIVVVRPRTEWSI
jgi:putative oxidoreductase